MADTSELEQPPGRLHGKVAVVTGAGAKGEGFGTGRAMACLFAEQGAKVCVVDRDADAASHTLLLIEETGGEGLVALGDVTKAEDCERIGAQAQQRFGAIDILVNNVGIATAATNGADTLDLEEWQRVMDTNLKSAVLMTKSCIGAMRESGSGAIVNVASIAGMLAFGGMAYGPSKAAMLQLTRELALVHGRDGIRANSVVPGHIYTPMLDGLIPDSARAVRRKAGPLGIEGDAWDVAYAALYLASDEARFITGICLPVDGGVSAIGSLAAAGLMASKE